MADTTNIMDLPSDPAAGNQSNNIIMTTNEMPNQMPPQNAMQQPINNQTNTTYNAEIPKPNNAMSAVDNQKMMNEIVSGIQQASAAGSTQLPSRDIPMQTSNIIQDQQIKPDFLPQEETKDYIFNDQMEQNILQASSKKQNQKDSLEVMYEELQVPIIIGLLYFLIQLPVVKKYFFKFFPALYNSDGNPSLGGYIVHSIVFASLFYVMLKVVKHFSQL